MTTKEKLILLALTALMMVGCEKEVVYTSDDINIVVIDSCEYLKCTTDVYTTYGINSFVYTHKGNCRFCKERKQKELEELTINLKEK